MGRAQPIALRLKNEEDQTSERAPTGAAPTLSAIAMSVGSSPPSFAAYLGSKPVEQRKDTRVSDGKSVLAGRRRPLNRRTAALRRSA
jgi:hypothetical protein